MGLTLLARMAVYTGKKLYIDTAAQFELNFGHFLMDPNENIFWHGYNFLDNHHSCCKWGRANGWGLMAMTEILLALEKFPGHPLTPAVKLLFKTLATGLKKYQDGKTGLLHQLIDNSTTFLETSASSMYLFSVVTGVMNGWIPKSEFAASILAMWKGLQTVIQPDGTVLGICEGTGIGTSPEWYNQRGTNYLNSAPGLGSVLRAIAAMDSYTP